MDRSKPKFPPTVKGATIATHEFGKGVDRFGHVPSESFGSPRPLTLSIIPCSNIDCRSGGYDVEGEFRIMVREKLTEKEFSRFRPGYEDSPKGRRISNRCLNIFHYRLTVIYKPETSTTQ
jgi:hypothetical protein